MKYQRFFLVFALPLLIVLSVAAASHAGEYKIGAGDLLEIAVWKNPDLTRQLTVLPDGTIHFPLIKEIKVEGLSVAALETMLVEKIKKFVPDPEISVSVLQVNSLMIYVIGKVNQPGRFMLNVNIDVLKALAIAGGLNPFAKEKEIAVFRKKGNQTQRFNFNYPEVTEGRNLEQNIMLERGDVIVVQ